MKTILIIITGVLLFNINASAQGGAGGPVELPSIRMWTTIYTSELKLSGKPHHYSKDAKNKKDKTKVIATYTRTVIRRYSKDGKTYELVTNEEITKTYKNDHIIEENIKITDEALYIYNGSKNDMKVKLDSGDYIIKFDMEESGNPKSQSPKTINIHTFSINHSAQPLYLVKKNLLKDYRATSKAVHLYFSLNYTPSVAYRSLSVRQSQFSDYASVDKRTANETSIYGDAYNIQAGITYRNKHTIAIEGLFLRQGFRSQNDTIQWPTGLAQPDTIGAKEYRFMYGGLGIGYNYTTYKHILNPVVEMGLYYMFINNRIVPMGKTTGYELGKSEQRNIGLHPNQFVGKLGLGISIRPNYRLDIKLMPVIYYNFTTTRGTVLGTRLHNAGITAGIGVRI